IEFFVLNGAVITLAVALSLVLATIVFWTRMRLVASALSLVGGVLLAGAWYYGSDSQRIAELEALLRKAETQNASLRDDARVADARAEDASEQLGAALRLHADQLARLHTRTDTLIDGLGDDLRPASRQADSRNRVDWSSDADVTRESNNQRYTAVRREIDTLGRALAEAQRRPARHVAAAPESAAEPGTLSQELRDLRSTMTYGLETDDYEVEVLPDNEVIRGQRGKYYVVDLKDAAQGIKFRFPGGKYTLARSDAAFRKALNSFVGDIAKKLEGGVRFGFFVRGSADSVPFRGRQLDDYRYEEVRYLKSVGDGRYRLGAETRQIETAIRNPDLPFLRARFLKDVVAQTYPVSAPVVLEGYITDRADQEDRNVELILYVDW
ncbi:MAG: hypothetical protein AAFQ42_09385, partial [Pseudomonadota bacterium]